MAGTRQGLLKGVCPAVETAVLGCVSGGGPATNRTAQQQSVVKEQLVQRPDQHNCGAAAPGVGVGGDCRTGQSSNGRTWAGSLPSTARRLAADTACHHLRRPAGHVLLAQARRQQGPRQPPRLVPHAQGRQVVRHQVDPRGALRVSAAACMPAAAHLPVPGSCVDQGMVWDMGPHRVHLHVGPTR